MALTDNTFTDQEFTAAVTANPELIKTVAGVLTTQKYIVHDEATHQNYLKKYESDVIAPKTKELADNIEKDVAALTGIAKSDPNMKYYDYLKSAFTKKLESVTELEAQIKTLKEKGGSSELDKQRITALEAQLAKEKQEAGEKITAKEKELLNTRSLHTIEKALNPFRSKYKATIPKEVAENYEATIIADVQKRYTIQPDEKSTVTLMGDDGKIILNAKFEPMSIEEYIGAKIKPILDEGKQQQGSGSGPNDKEKPGDNNNQPKTWDGVLPPDVKTKIQLSDYLYSIGVTSDSKEYAEAMEKHKDLPLGRR